MSIKIEEQGPILRVRLNRPEVKNALNDAIIQGLLDLLKKVAGQKEIRVVILSGEGDSFCAGGDLSWLKSTAPATPFAELLSTLNNLPKPVIAQVHGVAMGGALGLIAASDIAVAAEGTLFALSEVKVGLIPAIISPYLVSKVGVSAARRYCLTGERFKADQALASGLVHEVVPAPELEPKTLGLARELVSSGPEAMKACKELLRIIGGVNDPAIEHYTIEKIAELRSSPEGQEGINAFLEKRKPNW